MLGKLMFPILVIGIAVFVLMGGMKTITTQQGMIRQGEIYRHCSGTVNNFDYVIDPIMSPAVSKTASMPRMSDFVVKITLRPKDNSARLFIGSYDSVTISGIRSGGWTKYDYCLDNNPRCTTYLVGDDATSEILNDVKTDTDRVLSEALNDISDKKKGCVRRT